MLPKLHENAEKYYLPLMSTADAVTKHYPDKPEYAFFFYCSFLSMMKRVFNEIGGFYLKDQTGEDLVAQIWGTLLDEADRWFGRIERESLQRAVEPTHTYLEFGTVLRDAAVASAQRKFLLGAKEFAMQLPLFELFSAALWFETNVCYVVWYDKPPTFPKETFEGAIKRFEAAVGLGAKQHSSLITQLRHYGKDAQERVSALLKDTSRS